jgi:hypothetical protein
MKLCVKTQVAFRRVQRHPMTRHISKHVIKGTATGLVPSAVNDLVFHHAPLNFDEILHASQDTLAVSVLTLAITLLSKQTAFLDK